MFIYNKQKTTKDRVGDDLLSHAVTRILPSALAGLTSGFGMDPGVPPPLLSPTHSLVAFPFSKRLAPCLATENA